MRNTTRTARKMTRRKSKFRWPGLAGVAAALGSVLAVLADDRVQAALRDNPKLTIAAAVAVVAAVAQAATKPVVRKRGEREP